MTQDAGGGLPVAVFGTGSWGTSFTSVLAAAGNQVRMWGKFGDEVADITRTHCSPRYLPELTLPASVTATTDPAVALDSARVVVLALPAQALRANLAEWGADIPSDAVVVSLIKGLELGTRKRMSEVVAESSPVPAERIAVISGPNLAKEIARREPAATVVASASPEAAQLVADVCATSWFRPYTHHDVVGCELGGVVKNVIALAVGMAAGLGMGDSAKAAIITHGLHEMQRIGDVLGAEPATMLGLAGYGDLVTTCLSPLSRNQTFGRRLGEGKTVDEVVAVTEQTSEGVKSCGPVLELAQEHGVNVPIVESVVEVVLRGARAGDVIPQHVH